LNFDNSVCHVTLLGRMESNGAIKLPALLHFPDQGSFRLEAQVLSSATQTLNPSLIPDLPYATSAGDLGDNQAKLVRVTLPPATSDTPVIRYLWRVVTLYPAGVDAMDARFDGIRRDWLNIFQLAPRWHTLANHAASDTCAFCYYEYADVALPLGELAKGFSAMDMVRQTLDQIIGGANAYGMPGHGDFPEFSADTYPSLLIAACDCAKSQGAQPDDWVAANYTHLRSWAEKMLSTVHNNEGLIEYSLSGNSGSWPAHLKFRPANWWDTIGF